MDNYITYEFLKKLGKALKNEKQELRRKKAIEIFEGEKGKILPSKIAEILGISESQVIRYLGKTRLEKYGYKNFNASVKSKRSSETSRTVRDSGQKLTLTRVSKLVSDRNRRIKALYESGLPIEEVAEFEKEHLTIYLPVEGVSQNDYMAKYFELQTWFRKQLMTHSQKEVIGKLQENMNIKYQKLSSACQNNPTLQLQVGKPAKPVSFDVDQFVTTHPENGFLEEFCLSHENKAKVKQYRNKLSENH